MQGYRMSFLTHQAMITLPLLLPLWMQKQNDHPLVFDTWAQHWDPTSSPPSSHHIFHYSSKWPVWPTPWIRPDATSPTSRVELNIPLPPAFVCWCPCGCMFWLWLKGAPSHPCMVFSICLVRSYLQAVGCKYQVLEAYLINGSTLEASYPRCTSFSDSRLKQKS